MVLISLLYENYCKKIILKLKYRFTYNYDDLEEIN